MRKKVKLGVNVDHIATLRQARGEGQPVVLDAVKEVIAAGADSIVAHLREDRRHIQDKDIFDIRKSVKHFDMEMAATPEMLNIALKVRPDIVTLVPEKRQELTTEGGLDVASQIAKITRFAETLESRGIAVSLFIDPDPRQILASSRTGASFIELHTGAYARKPDKKNLEKIIASIIYAKDMGLKVNAGHGLDYKNAKNIASIAGVEELNIGFSIIARSVFVGLKQAVREMKKLMVLFFLIVLAFASQAATHEVSVAPSKEATLSGLSVSNLNAGPTRDAITPSYIASPEIYPEALPELSSLPRTTFPDMPVDHWAANSVEDLVKMGITQGYPDGTFRGSSYLSRYEMAVFLAKLARLKEEKDAANDKLLAELHSEIRKLKYEADQIKTPKAEGKPLDVSLETRVRAGKNITANSVATTVGPVMDYRLIASYQHDINDTDFFRLGIDTMDSSFNNGRDLASEMLEMEAYGELKPGLGLRVTTGPGLVVHNETGTNIFPSEDGRVYLRPSNGIEVSYGFGGLDTAVGYKVTGTSSIGIPDMNNLYAKLGYSFGHTFLGEVTMQYEVNDYLTDLRATYSTAEALVHMYQITVQPSNNVQYGLKYGVVAGSGMTHNSYVGLDLSSRDLLWDGNSCKLFANKIGSDFLSYPVYPGLIGANMFDKLYVSGTYDVGLALGQSITKTASVRLVSDVVTGPDGQYGADVPSSNACYEFDMDFGIFDSAVMTVAYRTYVIPSSVTYATSDMLGLFFKYDY